MKVTPHGRTFAKTISEAKRIKSHVKVGDVVVMRRGLVMPGKPPPKLGTMRGTVVKVKPPQSPRHSPTAVVEWESGSTGRHEVRMLEVVDRVGESVNEVRKDRIYRPCPGCKIKTADFDWSGTTKDDKGRTIQLYKCIGCGHERQVRRRAAKRGSPKQVKEVARAYEIIDPERFKVEEVMATFKDADGEERENPEVVLRILGKRHHDGSGLLWIPPRKQVRLEWREFAGKEKEHRGERAWSWLNIVAGVMEPSPDEDLDALFVMLRAHDDAPEKEAKRAEFRRQFDRLDHVDKMRAVSKLRKQMREAGLPTKRDARKKLVRA